jgi:hypothetical protein
MALDGATLVKRGSAAAGEQPNGIVAPYQLSGEDGLASTAITPYDSGTILGTVPPGKAGIKLVSGVIQNATDLICNVSPLGNTLTSANRPQDLGDPIVNTAQAASAGLSLAPEHE